MVKLARWSSPLLLLFVGCQPGELSVLTESEGAVSPGPDLSVAAPEASGRVSGAAPRDAATPPTDTAAPVGVKVVAAKFVTPREVRRRRDGWRGWPLRDRRDGRAGKPTPL